MCRYIAWSLDRRLNNVSCEQLWDAKARYCSGGLVQRLPVSGSLDNNFPTNSDAVECLLKYTVEGIAIIGTEERIEYVNEQVCKILARSPAEILGQTLFSFIHPDDRDLIEKRYTDRLEGETLPASYEIRVLRDRDTCRYLQVHTSVLTNGEKSPKILAQVLDVTEERMISSTLSNCETKYSTLVETMNEGLGIIDDHGCLVYANAALCKILSYTKSELVGKQVGDIMHDHSFDEVSATISKRMIGKSGRYKAFLIHKSGNLIPTQVSASPLFGETSEYKGSFALYTDMRSHERLKRDLQTARDRALLYIDLIGHDIRNHLQEILLSTELLKYKTEESSSLGLLESITQSVSKTAHIITETKTIEALDELPLRERCLDAVLNETIQAAIMLYDPVTFRMSIQVSEAQVLADDFLELLLSDLLSHACEHCEGEHRKVWVSLAQEENHYELIIKDNRSQTSEPIKKGQFDAVSHLGGIRLQLARFIVEKYGGTIDVSDRMDNEEKNGPTIKVLLPQMPEINT